MPNDLHSSRKTLIQQTVKPVIIGQEHRLLTRTLTLSFFTEIVSNTTRQMAIENGMNRSSVTCIYLPGVLLHLSIADKGAMGCSVAMASVKMVLDRCRIN